MIVGIADRSCSPSSSRTGLQVRFNCIIFRIHPLLMEASRSWSKNVDHCERLIREDWDIEMKMDASKTHPPITINLAEDDYEYDDVEEVLATSLENT
uniref:Uncharacterized protein n=1 Tax=Timema cristinae TaxID=61476 RepID=A0A7R9CVX4_TIMCR|nr:unnamed protein product [Timema cristinae]